MKLRNIKELQDKKAQLKSEISEMESILKFENPKKTLGLITNVFSEKYIGKSIKFKEENKFIPMMGSILKTSLKVGGAKFFNDIVKDRVNKIKLGKGILAVGGVVVVSMLVKKTAQKLDEYQREQTARSLEKLI